METKPRLRVVKPKKIQAVEPRPLNYVSTQLKRVLDAKLADNVTVEEASHIDLCYVEGLNGLTFEVFIEHKYLMHQAGLACSVSIKNYPDAIVIVDEKKFKKKFPELAHVIPLMKIHDGVLPYTAGRPRITPRPKLV